MVATSIASLLLAAGSVAAAAAVSSVALHADTRIKSEERWSPPVRDSTRPEQRRWPSQRTDVGWRKAIFRSPPQIHSMSLCIFRGRFDRISTAGEMSTLFASLLPVSALIVGATTLAASTRSLLFGGGRRDGDGKEGIIAKGGRRADAALRAFSFWRSAGPIVAHYKLTGFWMNARGASPDRRAEVWEALHEAHSPEALDIILRLRGLYVKIGQVMSSRVDFIPRQYVDRFQTLQDAVPPWPGEKIRGMVRQSLQTDHGLDFDEVFESFDDEALGSASIGQVHRAVLKPQHTTIGGFSGGPAVAVKVMHPEAKTQFANDFKVFRWLCRVALPGWGPILTELQRQMMTEFDYTSEAASLRVVRANMAKSPYSKRVKVPEPAEALCSRTVLVMEMLEGTKLAAAVEGRLAGALGGDVAMARELLKAKERELFLSYGPNTGRSGKKNFLKEVRSIIGGDSGVFGQAVTTLKLMSMMRKMNSMLDLLLDVHGHQIFRDGCFNGDPHPGNILEMPDGRLGLIDYGQVRRLSDKERLALSRVVLALGREEVNDSEVADAMRGLGFRSQKNRDDYISKTAALYFDSDAHGKALGYATPQFYLQYLSAHDPMLNVPDAAVFVARTSFLFRGMGALLQQQLQTASRWSHHACLALEEQGLH